MRERGAIPETTLLIGDSAIDHETARRAGVRVCLVPFGFGFDAFPKERLHGDEWIADSSDHLVQILRRFAEETAGYLVRANGSSYEK
jgi:phosphoglycolate phosphatase-like HAD superfamily hydrolase